MNNDEQDLISLSLGQIGDHSLPLLTVTSTSAEPAPAPNIPSIPPHNLSLDKLEDAGEEDPFEGINTSMKNLKKIVQVFRVASRKDLKGHPLRKSIADARIPNLTISIEARKKPYVYHAVREALGNRTVS